MSGSAGHVDRVDRSNVVSPVDPEDAAWAFYPERASWEDAGFGSWADTSGWIAAGMPPAEAKLWKNDGFDADEARRWTRRIEGWPTRIGGARTVANVVTSAVVYRRNGLSFDDTEPWDRLIPSISPKAIAWARERHLSPTEMRDLLEQVEPDPTLAFDSPNLRFARLTGEPAG